MTVFRLPGIYIFTPEFLSYCLVLKVFVKGGRRDDILLLL